MSAYKNELRRSGTWKKRWARISRKDDTATIMHAASAGTSSPMTPLEQAMATSPNDEILNAIGKDYLSVKLSDPFAPSLSPIEAWNLSPGTTLAPPFQSSDPEGSKIGVWRNGVALFDPPARQNYSRPVAVAYKPDFLTPQNLELRPNLSVIIPDAETAKHASSRSRYSLPVIPSAMASDNPSTSTTPHRSSIDSTIHPAFRDNKDFLENRPSIETSSSHLRGSSASRSESTAASRSSMASSTIPEEASDRASVYSRNSSMTSLGEQEAAEQQIDIMQDYGWSQANVPRRSGSSFSITSPVVAGVFDDLPAVIDQRNECPPSPTLSDVFHDLHKQLGTISEDYSIDQDYPLEEQVVSLIQLPLKDLSRVPSIPKRSRKREWRASSVATGKPIPALRANVDSLARRLSVPSNAESLNHWNPSQDTSGIWRSNSVRSTSNIDDQAFDAEMSLGSAQISLLVSAITSLGPAPESPSDVPVSPTVEAQGVLLRIMSSLMSLEDLQNTSMINRGMRQVYKTNELSLVRKVVRNRSPAAWELREWSSVAQTDLEFDDVSTTCKHSPSTYVQGLREDENIIKALKVLIVERCQTFLRAETAAALLFREDVNAQRFDDAFYRVWCFCQIFGCDKGREDDVTGQLDWLRGGLLAHQQDCAATVNINLEFDMGGVLLNAPDHFALGNADGLNASQLYDITEMWNCMTSLLAAFHGKTGLARHYGIYNDTGVAHGDMAGEEAMLEEWISYILTLGPSVVLELAHFSEDNINAGFKLAKLNGWTEWSLPNSGNSRCTFFREPVARLYEERVAMSANPNNVLEAREKKEMGRKRVASLAAEIKLARCSSTYQRLPVIDMASERAMSVVGRRDSAMPAPKNRSERWSTSSKRVSPVIEERVDSYNRLSAFNLGGVAENTADRAVSTIVAMGYSDVQAKEALRLTDMGNGLRVDRAVDLLLRQY